MNPYCVNGSARVLRLIPVIAALILSACSMPGSAPSLADPNAYNTLVAQTALAKGTVPPAVTAESNPLPIINTAPPSPIPTITATPGPSVLISASVSLPRHTALDFETKAISAPLADMNLIGQNLPDLSRYYQKAPVDSDIVFYSENPTDLSWAFLYPVHGVRMVYPLPEPFAAPSYEDCIQAFGGAGSLVPEDGAFGLDYYVFVTLPDGYHCFTTDRGNLGTFKLTAPGDYKSMEYVIIDYIVWDAKFP